STESKPGTRHHQPIHCRLQKASTMMGSTEYLVQTLTGFACFIQLSSVRLKTWAIFLSSVMGTLLSSWLPIVNAWIEVWGMGPARSRRVRGSRLKIDRRNTVTLQASSLGPRR